MTLELEILQELRSIKNVLAQNVSDYVQSNIAIKILGINNVRVLKHLHERGFLPRYSRGKYYVYKKADLYEVAKRIDKAEIII
ncbi:MAG: hypothetical protein WC223_10640 [Bacteroidales bacterium]|jgi:hypothetical protein